jgi:hypothetical protein
MSQAQIDRAALEKSLRDIVAAEFPEELETFDASASQVLEQVEATGRAPKAATAPNEFGEPVVEVLQFIGLIVSTYFTLKKFIKEFMAEADPSKRISALTETFASELQNNGIASAKASEIASRYSREIARTVKNEASS